MTEETPIELRKAEGRARIGGVHTPKCIFTIHVGTVVLSDQAVLCSRGKSLALSWRFYNQTTTMTRLLAGRVMNFDYSTEYDLKITDHFLHYLKHRSHLTIATYRFSGTWRDVGSPHPPLQIRNIPKTLYSVNHMRIRCDSTAVTSSGLRTFTWAKCWCTVRALSSTQQ
ncbi:jg10993 [Pararge aegeria aegeria]|uniref:Jg10993 protein n=1 Tax=Pararge aegeria aegeria TaxID=348720 RepID=A0A8S4SCY7_9NEOP|nr:jg10993 [Pararge aegeria aegeria]